MAENLEQAAMVDAAVATADPTRASSSRLFNVGYLSLLATQFFGAANDNVLKQCLTFMVATGIWSGTFGKNGLGEGGQVVPALCLTLPFILLSGYAGQISDKFSKRSVMYWVKVAEIPIAIVAFAGFYTHNLWLTIGAMLLLAVQSSFFGPAKYGVLPEIVAEEHLSMANGVINMLTNLAVIAGSLAAGPICDLFHPQPPPIPRVNYVISTGNGDATSLNIVVSPDEVSPARAEPNTVVTDQNTAAQGNLLDDVSAIGGEPPRISSASLDVDSNGSPDDLGLGVPTTLTSRDGDPIGELTLAEDGSFNFVPVPNYSELAAEPVPWAPGVALFFVAIGGLIAVLRFPKIKAANPGLKFDLNPFTTYFESIAVMSKGPLLAVVLAWAAFYMIAMIALLILPEYQKILTISFTETSYLLGILGIGIAIGSVITGWISGKEIRPWLIPVGAGGMCVAFLLLGLLTPTYKMVAALIFVAGFFAGFYIVPLQALIQTLSPDEERGRIIGTSGAISFCFSSLGPVVYWVANNPLGIPANRIFLICAAMAIVGTIYGAVQLKKIMDYRAQQQATTSGV